MPTTLRTLADVVYVANLLTCENFDWLYPESASASASGPDEIALARSAYGEILPQMDADAREMMAVFS